MKKITKILMAALVTVLSSSALLQQPVLAQEVVNTENHAADMQRIKDAFRYSVVGNETLNQDPALQTKINAINTNANKALADYIKPDVRESTIFGDFDLSDVATRGANNSNALDSTGKKIYDLVLAYSTFGSTHYQNQETKDVIVESLQWFYDNSFSKYYDYNPGGIMFGNWWNWEIGVPMRLSAIFALMDVEINEANPTLIQSYIDGMDGYLRNGKDGDVDLNARWHTGTNLADITMNRILQGVVMGDSQRIETSVSNLMTVFAVIDPENIIHGNTDGVYEDGSFIQHHRVAYTGTYGKMLLQRAIQAVMLLDGTKWQPTDQVSTMQNWIYKSFSPVIFEGYMMEIVKGRGVSRTATGYDDVTGIIESMVLLSNYLEGSAKLMMQQQVKYFASSMPTPLKEQNLALSAVVPFRAIMNDASIVATSNTQNGHYAFNAMEKNVHVRDDYTFALSRSSERISKYEYMSGENLKAWFQGDGTFYLYQAGRDETNSYGTRYFATMNPYRMPGTTVPDEERKTIFELYGETFYPGFGAGTVEQNDYVYFPVGDNSYSGSVSKNGSAVAGMQLGDENAYAAKQEGILGDDFLNAYKNADANKSWFMFDDEVVVLGSNVSDALGRSVTTTIDNRMSATSEVSDITAQMKDQDDVVQVNDTLEGNLSWLHYGTDKVGTQVGYYFPTTKNVSVLNEQRSGSLKDIRRGNPDTIVSQNFLTMTYAHGVNPQKDTYEYIMLPNKTEEETKAYANASNVEIIKNDENVHAVRHNGLQLTGYNFFSTQETTAGDITTSNQVTMMTEEKDARFDVSLSDPTNKQELITIRVKKNLTLLTRSDATVSYDGEYTTIQANVANKNGAPLELSFQVNPTTGTGEGETPNPNVPQGGKHPSTSNVNTSDSTNLNSLMGVLLLSLTGLLALKIKKNQN